MRVDPQGMLDFARSIINFSYNYKRLLLGIVPPTIWSFIAIFLILLIDILGRRIASFIKQVKVSIVCWHSIRLHCLGHVCISKKKILFVLVMVRGRGRRRGSEEGGKRFLWFRIVHWVVKLFTQKSAFGWELNAFDVYADFA